MLIFPWRALSPPIGQEGSRLSDDPFFEHINPQLLAQPFIGAEKLRGMWKDAMKRWNNLKVSPRSGDSEGLLEKSEGVQQTCQNIVEPILQCLRWRKMGSTKFPGFQSHP